MNIQESLTKSYPVINLKCKETYETIQKSWVIIVYTVYKRAWLIDTL